MELPGLRWLRQAQAPVARLSVELEDSFSRWHFARTPAPIANTVSLTEEALHVLPARCPSP
eukprot:14600518-Alexandrium_andersonii.AAC.1